ncbi:hypothetical protein [Paenibacillus eucommiae]|uniref:Uncharacterized protein n=1 Tax=Paenibacillus eucommiae TaxID=1355755 RepID=A0ABS4JBY6_9BACL|nr:hypothetical protein [Paenibacillus eucommiae]MBP1996254.1 hypothetical protein [Paenibacillus eucommiae]
MNPNELYGIGGTQKSGEFTYIAGLKRSRRELLVPIRKIEDGGAV